MEGLASPCYSDVGVDQGFFNQWGLADLGQLSGQPLELALGQDLEQSPSSESYSASYPSNNTHERPTEAIKASSWSSCTTELNSVPRILAFGNPDSPVCRPSLCAGHAAETKKKEDMDVDAPHGSKRKYDVAILAHGTAKTAANVGGARTSSHNQEHIIAERKRREKLSQRFIELSAVVPGLKKMDKASVLGDGIKYLKQLQEKVTSLEEQVAKRSFESAVLVNKSLLCVDDDSSSCDGYSNERQCGEPLPEIEARVCDKSVLIKIHCDNRKGVLVKALSEIEKLHLCVVNTSVVPFTASSLDITVMSQIEEDFSMTAKDVVKKLHIQLSDKSCDEKASSFGKRTLN